MDKKVPVTFWKSVGSASASGLRMRTPDPDRIYQGGICAFQVLLCPMITL